MRLAAPILWRGARDTCRGWAASINVDNVERLLMHFHIWYARIPRGQKVKVSDLHNTGTKPRIDASGVVHTGHADSTGTFTYLYVLGTHRTHFLPLLATSPDNPITQRSIWKDATALLGSHRLTTRHGFDRPPVATARFNGSRIP